MKFVGIPGGYFTMGSPEEESGWIQERPLHNVHISNGFYMGAYEVTQQNYQNVMGINPARFKGPNNPAESVSWEDSVEFCRRLSIKDGVKYRLPTEAEWEYACRAGTTTPFYTGQTISTDHANFNGQISYGKCLRGEYRQKTLPVGSFPPNEFGLYDMLGNVFNWCNDWYAKYYYSSSPQNDPRGPDTGNCKVLRGGSWIDSPAICRSAARCYNDPSKPTAQFMDRYGFRVVADFPPPANPSFPTLQAKYPKNHAAAAEPSEPKLEIQSPKEAKAPSTEAREPVVFPQPKPEKRIGVPRDWPSEMKLVKVATPQGEKSKEIVYYTNTIGMKLVRIPAGEFMMGSPQEEKERGPEEGPQHKVSITNAFFLGAYEVTQGQYESIIGQNPAQLKANNNPVDAVSWSDGVEFCKRLSEKEGVKYRLPTEAEWEFACRAGSTTPFYFGETISMEQANYGGNRQMTSAVGRFTPNAFGVYDTHGNVWEWCQDWYDESYYGNSPGEDPQGPSAGILRVVRGGSWGTLAANLRSATRRGKNPMDRSTNFGFRVVCDGVVGR